MTQQFFWPPGYLAGRSVKGALTPKGIALPDFTTPTTPIPLFTGSGFGSVSLSSSFAAKQGFSGCSSDADGGIWALTYDGVLANPYGTWSLPSTDVWIGLTVIGAAPYAVSAASGMAYTLAFSEPAAVGSGFGGQVWGVASNGASMLYAPMPDGRLGTLDVTTGVASGIASPITLPYLVAAASGVASGSDSGVAIAGISTATLASGTGYLAASPVSPTSVAAATSPSANALILLTGSDPDWAITGALTGFTSPGQIAWATTGSQFLASQPASNAVSVISVVGSGLSIAQTLSLTDPTQIAVTEDGTEALVVRPSAGTVTVLANSSGTWSIGSGVAVPGAVSVVMTGESSAAVAATAGVVFLARSGTTWGIQSTVALSFSPTRVTADADGTVYVVGTAGSHGFLNVISGGSIIGTMEWTGTGDDVLVDQTKIIILNNLEYQILFASIIGSGSGAVFFSEPQSQVSRSGATSLAMTGSETIWLCGSDTLLGELAHPFSINWRQDGQLAVYASGQWAITSFGIEARPTALTWRADGTVWVAVADSVLSFNAVTPGQLTAGSVITVPVYSGQDAGTALGLSSLNWQGDSLFATTCLSGVVVQVQ